ncbi:MAG TPA: cation:proton antiporter [Patescibacteria group bacterium]|nr:cation:proton antiporter [Patescibacteria group bacterium]
MDETARPILEVGAMLLAAAGAGWLARRLGLPAVIGYLAVGLLVSPFTPGYVAEHDQLILFADVGVVFLLFEVGIEVDLGRLQRDQGALLWAAPVQTGLTMAIASGAFLAAGLEPPAAALLGLSIALSSSVVIVNITRSRRRTTDPHTERVLVGWGVLQDVTGVAIAIVLLAILGSGRPFVESLVGLAVFGALVVAVAKLLPLALHRLRPEHDLFLLVSVSTGLAVAGAGAVLAGIPIALAAFIAGLAISDSHDAAEARRRLLPFRDVFAVFFFVAIGTLIDPRALAAGLPWFFLAVALVVVAKSAVAWLLVRTTGLSDSPLQVAVGLGQIGEFSFVLASVALARGAIGSDVFAAMLAAVAATIAGSTILVRLVRRAPVAPTPIAET